MAREIVGIYADETSASYYCLKKTIFGFKPRLSGSDPGSGPGLDNDASCRIDQGGAPGIKEILKRIYPDSGRKIYLALPRSFFFIREIKLPQLPVEDALDAVKNSINLYLHLPLDEIYYDIFISPKFKDSTRCLLIYAPKKQIDHFRDVFQDTGHGKALKAVFPISYGICAWMQINKPFFPAGIVHQCQGSCELSVMDKKSWLWSVSWDLKDGKGFAMALSDALSRFPGVGENLYRTGGVLQGQDDDPTDDQVPYFTPIDALLKNISAAAVAPALGRIQQISLDGSEVKVDVVKPFRYIAVIFCIVAALLFYLTSTLKSDIAQYEQKRAQLKVSVDTLQRKIQPIQEKVQLLKLAAAGKEDAEFFVKNRPKLYTCINEIARLVPEGTWFSNFNYDKFTMNLSGHGQDALLTMEKLRKSPLFSKVQLKGAVSRGPQGQEQFSLELTLIQKGETPYE